MEIILRRKAILVGVLLLLALLRIPFLKVENIQVLTILLFGLFFILIIFFIPVMAISELITYKFSPRVRAVLSLVIQIVLLFFGFLTLNFLGAVIQEVDPKDILPQTKQDTLIFSPIIILLWVVDEFLRYWFREPSAVIKRKPKI